MNPSKFYNLECEKKKSVQNGNILNYKETRVKRLCYTLRKKRSLIRHEEEKQKKKKKEQIVLAIYDYK